MLLKRLVEHFKKQAWTAIGLDFLIVVLGVFMAAQLTNWNAERIERAQERDLLIRLYEDFEESISGQDRDLRFLDTQLSDQAAILRSLDACAVAPADRQAFQRGVSTLGFINPPRLSRRTIDELAASGRTDVIRSEAIKEELASIVALAEWRGKGFDQVARMTEHFRFIVEENVRYDLAETYPDEFLGDIVGVDYNIRAMCAKPSMASAVSAISNTTRNRRNAYSPLLTRYRAFLPILADELQRRWGVRVAEEARN